MKALLGIAAVVGGVVLANATAGCLRTTSYKCSSSDQCGAEGVCEETGYCSFADADCADGRRYAEYSGTYSSKCVGEVVVDGDGGVDAPGDGSTTDVPQGNCPSTYAALSGASGRLYRVITTTGAWAAQRAACAADGSNTYLAVPETQAELTAIVTAANATIWVGIEDAAPDDDTFVTVRNATAYPTNNGLWATSGGTEPDDAPEQTGGGPNTAECVSASTANSGKLADDRCTETYAAVCECEP